MKAYCKVHSGESLSLNIKRANVFRKMADVQLTYRALTWHCHRGCFKLLLSHCSQNGDPGNK